MVLHPINQKSKHSYLADVSKAVIEVLQRINRITSRFDHLRRLHVHSERLEEQVCDLEVVELVRVDNISVGQPADAHATVVHHVWLEEEGTQSRHHQANDARRAEFKLVGFVVAAQVVDRTECSFTHKRVLEFKS